MTPRAALVVLLVAVSLASFVPTAATAQMTLMPDTYGGDIWSRPRLTGDWGGWRDAAANAAACTAPSKRGHASRRSIP